MSSLVFSQQNNHNIKDFPKNPTDQSLSTLASHYMKMFDFPQPENVLLGKRSAQSLGNLSQILLEKKTKTSFFANNMATNSVSSILPGISVQQKFMMNSPLQNFDKFDPNTLGLLALHQNFALGSINEIGLGYEQNNFLRENDVLDGDGILIKEEFMKQEECDQNNQSISIHTNSLKTKVKLHQKNSSSYEHSNNDYKTSHKNSEFDENEPVLSEFTKSYPDWDLLTIFRFLRSGKSRIAFEAERKVKKENIEEYDSDNSDYIKKKQTKGKNKKDPDGDYRPYRSAKKPQKQSKKPNKKQSKLLKIEYKQEEI